MEFFDRSASNDTKLTSIIMGGLIVMTAIICYTWVLVD